MTSLRRACLLFVLLIVSGLGAQALDREAFTFVRYDLEMVVDPAKGTLACSGNIELRNDSAAAQSNVVLQISSSLQWTSIRAGEADLAFVAQTYTSDIDHTGALMEAIVTLPKPVPPKSSVTLEVSYAGGVPRDATRLTRIGTPEKYAFASDWDQISDTFTAVRGVGFVTWFPVAITSANLSEGNSVLEVLAQWKNRHAGSVAQFSLALRAATGGAQRQSIRFNAASAPCPNAPETPSGCVSVSYRGFRVVPTFAIAPYEDLDRAGIKVAFLPEHTSTARDYAVAAERVQPLIAEWFGPAREKVQVIDLGEPEAQSYESGPFLFTPLKSLDRNLVELTMAHQLVHASFESPRLWIAEGLAHFMQAIVRERQAGRRAAISFLSQSLAPLATVEKRVQQADGSAASTGESLVNTYDPLYYRGKASYVWFMLRDMLGDDVLRDALRTYSAQEDRQPAYVQGLLEKGTGKAFPVRSLEWFFDEWVYRDRGLPDFRVDSAYARKSLDGAYVVTVTVINDGRAGAEVPVGVSSDAGERFSRVMVPAGAKGVVRIQFPSPPTAAEVNDGSVPETEMGNNRFNLPIAR